MAQQAQSGFPHRHPRFQDHLVTNNEDVKTMYDLYARSLRLYGSRPAVGTRRNAGKPNVGQYDFLTYKQLIERAYAFGSGLAHLGMKPGQMLGVYMPNREEAVACDIAGATYKFPIVSLYDTFGDEAVEYITNHAELTTLVCSSDKFARILKLVEKCPSLKIIVLTDEVTATQQRDFQAVTAGRGLKLSSYVQARKEGLLHPSPHATPTPEDIATILYTSGTTGNPKGVILLHRNVISVVCAIEQRGIINPDDSHISYLPMAHVYERVVQSFLLLAGSSFGFYQGDVTKLIDDIAELRPSLFVGVPRVFQRIYDKVMSQVNESLWHRRQLFSYAFNAKAEAMKNGETTPLLDSLVFSKIRARLGGRVRLIVSGAAPLSPVLAQFLKICFCCPVVQGYGLSETCAGATAMDPEDGTIGHVGMPMPCNEIKLESVPEMEYTVNDKPFPRGEILVRGSNVFAGYYKDPAATAECFTPDGWFRMALVSLCTGDIGQWLGKEAKLQIIDRKKNIFKLAQGEYVAAERLEGIFIRSPLVGQIWVYGDSFKDHLVAIVVPHLENTAPWVKANLPDLAALKREDLCKNDKFKAAVQADLHRVATEAGLKGFEHVKSIYLEPAEITPGDLMTPTMKLRRVGLKKQYQAVLDKLYAGSPAIQSRM